MACTRKLFVSCTGLALCVARDEFTVYDTGTALFFIGGKSIEELLLRKSDRIKEYLGEKGIDSMRLILEIAQEHGRLQFRSTIYGEAFNELNTLVARAGLEQGTFPERIHRFDKRTAQIVIERANNRPGQPLVIEVIR